MEDSTWYALNLSDVLDVMHLSDDLVQSKCEMMLHGQKPTSLIGGSMCPESGELHDPCERIEVCFESVRETAQ